MAIRLGAAGATALNGGVGSLASCPGGPNVDVTVAAGESANRIKFSEDDTDGGAFIGLVRKNVLTAAGAPGASDSIFIPRSPPATILYPLAMLSYLSATSLYSCTIRPEK